MTIDPSVQGTKSRYMVVQHASVCADARKRIAETASVLSTDAGARKPLARSDAPSLAVWAVAVERSGRDHPVHEAKLR